MSGFRLVTGSNVPGGPRALGIPIGGPRASKGPRQSFASKKGYTGSRAGLGRMAGGVVARQGPGGPRRFAGAVMLPARMKFAAAPRPAKRPSLFARVGQRMRRAAASFGL